MLLGESESQRSSEPIDTHNERFIVNQQLRSVLKWLSVEVVVLALWWFGPGNNHDDVSTKFSMLLVMHAYLLALLVNRGADPCQRWWRNRGHEQTDSST